MDVKPANLELRITAVRKGQYDVEIVQAVRARKVLYDKSHEHHKNPRVKEVEWQRIGEELEVPSAYVIKRWTVIRERFASEKRKVQQQVPSSWWLMDHMDWLDVHIQPRQRSKFYADSDSNLQNLSYRQGKYYPDTKPVLANMPNLTHISNLSNYSINSNNSNYSLKYENGIDEDDNDDTRSLSPIIAYPEVLMKDDASDEECRSYNSYDNNTNNEESDKDSLKRRHMSTEDNNSDGPLSHGLDMDEVAAARIMAALKALDDPLLRHMYRQKVHSLAQECELAALHTEKKRKEAE